MAKLRRAGLLRGRKRVLDQCVRSLRYDNEGYRVTLPQTPTPVTPKTAPLCKMVKARFSRRALCSSRTTRPTARLLLPQIKAAASCAALLYLHSDQHCNDAQRDEKSNTAGRPLNEGHGGVWAIDYNSGSVGMWFFPRSTIPADIASANPGASL